jgi:hypothetical protein
MFPRIAVALLVLVGACGPSVPPERVPEGTWGGEGSALIVSAQEAHVHIDCTKGDIAGPIPLDDQGRFDVGGVYNVDAYPIDRGILHPARFTGRLMGRSLALSVRLTDTDRTLGPVVVTLGREPELGPCPICRRP